MYVCPYPQIPFIFTGYAKAELRIEAYIMLYKR